MQQPNVFSSNVHCNSDLIVNIVDYPILDVHLTVRSLDNIDDKICAEWVENPLIVELNQLE